MKDIIFAAWKHQAKDGRTVVYCTPDDRDNIHLTADGLKKAEEIGAKGELIPSGCALVHAYLSTYVRVLETHQALLRGAGYQLQASGMRTARRLGLDFFGMNWNHQLVPDDNDPRAVQKFVEDLYFQKDERAPSFAKFVFGTLDSLVSGLEAALEEQPHVDGKQLVTLGTHTYILDALAMVLFDYLTVNPDKKSASVCEDSFPGMYGKEDFVTGRVIGGASDNPTLEITAKGNAAKGQPGSRYIRLLSLDTIKQRRDEAYQHTLLIA